MAWNKFSGDQDHLFRLEYPDPALGIPVRPATLGHLLGDWFFFFEDRPRVLEPEKLHVIEEDRPSAVETVSLNGPFAGDAETQAFLATTAMPGGIHNRLLNIIGE